VASGALRHTSGSFLDERLHSRWAILRRRPGFCDALGTSPNLV